ncbi:aldehyde ferredoxin oxidoreductase family protein [Thermoanaerobacterium sp. DL9XJH110]|uniref:aldehyde ferredoxin oxidoreductase family protein n=1 Tax=Thermoanaerobacterium sp. DL9XJH110 TaxID=3386643 RepID=UPI003BB587BC
MKIQYPPAYTGQQLRVNLTTGEIKKEPVNLDWLEKYIGGTGYGIRILYEELPEFTDPFHPDNRLIFATGPMTGSGAPGSGNYSIVTKSPLSGFAVSAQSNGHFGPHLKRAGYDFLIFYGSADHPVYLAIEDGEVRLLDASDLAGKETFETEEILVKRHSGQGINAKVACIGPAGENRVRFAGIFNCRGHVAASGGVGAVMGSKNLKAVVVSGKNRYRLGDNRSKFVKLIKEWVEDIKSHGTGKVIDTLGSAGLFSSYYSLGWVPVKNLTTNEYDAVDKMDGIYLRKKFPALRNSCYGCPLDHCKRMTVTEGPYKGNIFEEPEYEDLAGWGPNIGVKDPGTAMKITDFTDRLGMDLKEATFIVSLIMECYEKGLLDKTRLDGLTMEWGNAENVMKLLWKIAHREGVGQYIADGIVSTARWIGGDALNRAVYVKRGYAPHVHDLRTRWGTIFTQAVSQMGSQQGIDLTDKASPDIGITEPVGFSLEGIPRAEAISSCKRQFEDCLGLCFYTCRGKKGMVTQLEALNIVTGWNIDIDGALEIGERVINLLRLFNIKNGHTKEDDSVSYRLLEPPVDGPNRGKSLKKDAFEKMLAIYYETMGWNEEGVPLPQTLKRLGLYDLLEGENK